MNNVVKSIWGVGSRQIIATEFFESSFQLNAHHLFFNAPNLIRHNNDISE